MIIYYFNQQSNEKVLQIVEIVAGQDDKPAWLQRHLPQLVAAGAVLVFVSRKRDAAILSMNLSKQGFKGEDV